MTRTAMRRVSFLGLVLVIVAAAAWGCDRRDSYDIESLSRTNIMSEVAVGAFVRLSELLSSEEGQICLFRPYSNKLNDTDRFPFGDQLKNLWTVSEGEFHIALFQSGKMMLNSYKRRPTFDVANFDQQITINKEDFISVQCGNVNKAYLYLSRGSRGTLVNIIERKIGA